MEDYCFPLAITSVIMFDRSNSGPKDGMKTLLQFWTPSSLVEDFLRRKYLLEHAVIVAHFVRVFQKYVTQFLDDPGMKQLFEALLHTKSNGNQRGKDWTKEIIKFLSEIYEDISSWRWTRRMNPIHDLATCVSIDRYFSGLIPQVLEFMYQNARAVYAKNRVKLPGSTPKVNLSVWKDEVTMFMEEKARQGATVNLALFVVGLVQEVPQFSIPDDLDMTALLDVLFSGDATNFEVRCIVEFLHFVGRLEVLGAAFMRDVNPEIKGRVAGWLLQYEQNPRQYFAMDEIVHMIEALSSCVFGQRVFRSLMLALVHDIDGCVNDYRGSFRSEPNLSRFVARLRSKGVSLLPRMQLWEGSCAQLSWKIIISGRAECS